MLYLKLYLIICPWIILTTNVRGELDRLLQVVKSKKSLLEEIGGNHPNGVELVEGILSNNDNNEIKNAIASIAKTVKSPELCGFLGGNNLAQQKFFSSYEFLRSFEDWKKLDCPNLTLDQHAIFPIEMLNDFKPQTILEIPPLTLAKILHGRIVHGHLHVSEFMSDEIELSEDVSKDVGFMEFDPLWDLLVPTTFPTIRYIGNNSTFKLYCDRHLSVDRTGAANGVLQDINKFKIYHFKLQLLVLVQYIDDFFDDSLMNALILARDRSFQLIKDSEMLGYNMDEYKRIMGLIASPLLFDAMINFDPNIESHLVIRKIFKVNENENVEYVLATPDQVLDLIGFSNDSVYRDLSAHGKGWFRSALYMSISDGSNNSLLPFNANIQSVNENDFNYYESALVATLLKKYPSSLFCLIKHALTSFSQESIFIQFLKDELVHTPGLRAELVSLLLKHLNPTSLQWIIKLGAAARGDHIVLNNDHGLDFMFGRPLIDNLKIEALSPQRATDDAIDEPINQSSACTSNEKSLTDLSQRVRPSPNSLEDLESQFKGTSSKRQRLSPSKRFALYIRYYGRFEPFTNLNYSEEAILVVSLLYADLDMNISKRVESLVIQYYNQLDMETDKKCKTASPEVIASLGGGNQSIVLAELHQNLVNPILSSLNAVEKEEFAQFSGQINFVRTFMNAISNSIRTHPLTKFVVSYQGSQAYGSGLFMDALPKLVKMIGMPRFRMLRDAPTGKFPALLLLPSRMGAIGFIHGLMITHDLSPPWEFSEHYKEFLFYQWPKEKEGQYLDRFIDCFYKNELDFVSMTIKEYLKELKEWRESPNSLSRPEFTLPSHFRITKYGYFEISHEYLEIFQKYFRYEIEELENDTEFSFNNYIMQFRATIKSCLVKGRFEYIRSLLFFFRSSIKSSLNFEFFNKLLKKVPIDREAFLKSIVYDPILDVNNGPIQSDLPVQEIFEKIVREELDENEVSKLLSFIGVSSPPIGGFPANYVKLSPVLNLPISTSRTCFRILRFAIFQSYEQTVDRLKMAISGDQEFVMQEN